MGVSKYCRTSPFLQAMKVHRVEDSLNVNTLDLLRSMLSSNSGARSFYLHLLNMSVCGKLLSHHNLVTHASQVCQIHSVSFLKYMFDDRYFKSTRGALKCFTVNDRLVDSVAQMLLFNDPYSNVILNMLLCPF